jgi:methylated-DNA-protein-cysteine methyltransferase-like protein
MVIRRDSEGTHNRIFAVVRRIPSGRVLTYGDVAALAGMPEHARLVGYALHALPEHSAVPWHRVINHKGGISTGRAWPGGELVQRSLLEAEGLQFDANGRTSLKHYRWTPGDDADAGHPDAPD